MADEELPLAEVRATVTAQRRAKHYVISWLIFEEEDQRALDAFLNGPLGRDVVLMSLRPLPMDWAAPEVDPNQGASVEDEARWQEDFVRIVSHMTDHADPPT